MRTNKWIDWLFLNVKSEVFKLCDGTRCTNNISLWYVRIDKKPRDISTPKLTYEDFKDTMYQRGKQNPYIEEGETTQWPKEKGQATIYKAYT